MDSSGFLGAFRDLPCMIGWFPQNLQNLHGFDLHCVVVQLPRNTLDFHALLTTFSEKKPGFASPGSAQDLHHHYHHDHHHHHHHHKNNNNNNVFPVLSTWLAIENCCEHISSHMAKNHYMQKFAQNGL